jgi:hypothetical protein
VRMLDKFSVTFDSQLREFLEKLWTDSYRFESLCTRYYCLEVFKNYVAIDIILNLLICVSDLTTMDSMTHGLPIILVLAVLLGATADIILS